MHPDWWTVGLQVVNFGILAWLLQRFLYKPVLALIEARKAEIRSQFEAARAAEEKARAHLAAIEAEHAGIAAEREAALQAAAAQAQALAESRRAKAEREAQELAEATRKTLGQEREEALDAARRLALDLGTEFAHRLLAEVPMQYRAEAWIERIEQHVKALEPPERDALARQLADGKPLTVVTAGALPPATIEQWKLRLCDVLGTRAPINFEVDPDLIAGAELHFPTAILRFSWQNTLATARSEVSARAEPR